MRFVTCKVWAVPGEGREPGVCGVRWGSNRFAPGEVYGEGSVVVGTSYIPSNTHTHIVTLSLTHMDTD
jgi:hypothetical protein